jgi:ribosomal protein RSM22 (predicted rRNA methylase)
MELPFELQQALTKTLSTIPPQRLSRAAEQLSQRYRAGGATSSEALVASADDVLAYAAHRMPATYAALSAIMTEAAALCAIEPRTMLDVGSGTGAALWAASACWPSLEHVQCVEGNQGMLTLGRQLASQSQHLAITNATWRRVDLAAQWAIPTADLVTAGYLFNELAAATRGRLIKDLWDATRQLLLIVEPGTPAGFEFVREARAALIAAGAHVIAPCPHNEACPMAGGDWCHFAQRLVRPPFQRRVKGAELGYEDEKFSYVAVARTPGTPIAARVLRHPRYLPGRVELQLCTADGLQQRTVTKSDREAYRKARDVSWGDSF